VFYIVVNLFFILQFDMMYVKNHLNNINLMCQILHFVQCTQFADDFRLLIFILKRRKAEQQ